MSEWAISSTGLSKRYSHDRLAVDDLELRVPQGAVYGFVGPNGSGKTTTIRMLLGLVRPTAGSCRVLDHLVEDSAGRVLHSVGALVEGPAFYPYLSGHANLMRLDCADRSANPRTAKARIEHALERVGLTAVAAKKFRHYSLGMRQRLAIAAALTQPRELLLLDEPTNGLDPQGTREVRQLVASLAAQGTTVFVSSHLLNEVEQMCSDVGVMSAGKLVWQGPIGQLIADQRSHVQLESADTELAVRALTELGFADIRVCGEQITAPASPSLKPEEIVVALVRAGVGVRGFTVVRADLEDAFVELTGSGFDVSG